MSRGSRVGSSWSSPTSTSRSTSTWRAGPWQACTCTLRSSSASARPESSTGVGAWLARMSACRCPSRSSPAGTAPSEGASTAPGRTANERCSSRASRPSEASRGCPAYVEERSSSRGTGPSVLGPARSAQSAAEACGSQRWTSRCSPSAPSSSTSVAGSRVWPNRESRPGRSSPVPPAASAASVCSWRTSGGGSPTRDTSRRHSSACHARSSGSGSRPSVSSPRRQARTRSTRWRAYEEYSPASRWATA